MMRIRNLLTLFFASILLVAMSANADEENQNNRYRVGGIISGAYLLPALQSSYPQGKEPDSGGGISLTFDGFVGATRNHGIAVDLHFLNVALEDPKETANTRALYLGYRYHFPFGLYVGGGLVPYADVSVTGDGGNEERTVAGAPLGINLGYVKTFGSGFSVGFNALGTTAVDEGLYAVNTIGIVLGYTGRN